MQDNNTIKFSDEGETQTQKDFSNEVYVETINQVGKHKEISELEGLFKYLTLENVIFGLMIVLLLVLRLIFFPFESGDWIGFLKGWVKYIDENNGILAFKDRFYDYTPAYLYFIWIGTVFKFNMLAWIKLGSVIFDFVMAYYVSKIVSLKNKEYFKYAFLTTLMLPTLLFNSAWWGQCDVIYSSFVVGALYYLLIKKNIRAFVFMGIALSLKLQAIFFAPVILILIITRNLPKKSLLTFPAIFVAIYTATIIPAFLLKRSLFDGANGLYTIYYNQSKAWSGLVMGATPNIYQWLDPKKYDIFYPAGLVITTIAVLFLALYFVKARIKNVNNDGIIKLSLISVTLVPFLLPKMHERYFFLAEVVSIIFCFYFPKKFWVGVVTTVSAIGIYVSGVIGGPIPNLMDRNFLSLWYLILIVYLVWDMVRFFGKPDERISNS
jgi:Gpi18-like mannosyltransferase